jgi:DNA-binding transcriptional LysR family regulator
LDPDYQLFANVVQAGSLSAAGREMGISPAMVSKRMARLEARLGARLVHRTTRKLSLTQSGEQFHADVVVILRQIHEAEARITGERHEPHGPLIVSAPTSFGRLHVAPHIGEFLAGFPAVLLELNLTDAFVDLVADRVDLAIRIAPEVPPGLAAHRLATSRRILCASPAYLERSGAPEGIADLARHRLLAASGQFPWRLTDGRRRQLINGTSHVRTNSSEIVRELALAGVGIALRSLWDVSGALAAGTLCQVLPVWEGPRDLGIYAVHLPSPLVSPAILAFIEFLERRFVSMPWEA